MPNASKPRVMVSSVVEGYSEYREAARRGIVAAGGEPVLVNEDFPALAVSPRNACLDAVASADILMVIIGERGGFQAPSGKLVVAEEADEAQRRRIPLLVFVENVEHDHDAERLVQSLSDFVDGQFRIAFNSPGQLQQEVERSLCPIIEHQGNPIMDANQVQELLMDHQSIGQEVSVRIVIAPEREGEVIDPVKLGSDTFIHRLYELGHSAATGLFSYQLPKAPEHITGDALVLHQRDNETNRQAIDEVRLEIHENGSIVVDANVTGQKEQSAIAGFPLKNIVVDEDDIAGRLLSVIRFTASLYDDIDAFKRHHRFLWNAALANLGDRTIEKNPKPRSSFSYPSYSDHEPIIAFSMPREIDRMTLSSPEQEVARAILKIKRQVGDRDQSTRGVF